MSRAAVNAGLAQAKREGQFLWKMLVVVLIGGFLIVEPLERLYDRHIRERPFITATVEILPAPVGKPMVRYLASADTPVQARWSAWISVEGSRGCGGGGSSGYGPPPKTAKLWSWADWLGADCHVPAGPFRLCVRYAGQTQTGVGDVSGPFCSEVFDPREEKP